MRDVSVVFGGIVALNRTLDAATAREWGLVSEVYPDDQLMAEAEKLAGRIVQQPPQALRMIVLGREHVERVEHHPLAQLVGADPAIEKCDFLGRGDALVLPLVDGLHEIAGFEQAVELPAGRKMLRPIEHHRRYGLNKSHQNPKKPLTPTKTQYLLLYRHY